MIMIKFAHNEKKLEMTHYLHNKVVIWLTQNDLGSNPFARKFYKTFIFCSGE